MPPKVEKKGRSTRDQFKPRLTCRWEVEHARKSKLDGIKVTPDETGGLPSTYDPCSHAGGVYTTGDQRQTQVRYRTKPRELERVRFANVKLSSEYWHGRGVPNGFRGANLYTSPSTIICEQINAPPEDNLDAKR